MMKKLSKLLYTAFFMVMAVGAAQAQGYPSTSIRVVIPFGAGTATDVLTRSLAKGLTDRLGQPVIIENRPGAAGNIGTEIGARAPADGYTLLMSTSGPLAANVSLYKLPYDPLVDLTPVALIATVPTILVGNPGTGISTLPELIKAAKAKPGSLQFGASNTTARIWVELLKEAAGIDVNLVPYRSVGGLMTDLLSGQIHFSVENIAPSLPQIKAGKLTPIAVNSPSRVASVPETPTMAEAGLTSRGVNELVVWIAMHAPKGTPAEIVTRINTELNALLKTEEIRQLAAQLSIQLAGGSPQQLQTFHAAEIEKWRRLVAATGVKVD